MARQLDFWSNLCTRQHTLSSLGSLTSRFGLVVDKCRFSGLRSPLDSFRSTFTLSEVTSAFFASLASLDDGYVLHALVRSILPTFRACHLDAAQTHPIWDVGEQWYISHAVLSFR